MQQAVFMMQLMMSDSLGCDSAITGGTPECPAAGIGDTEAATRSRKTWLGRRLCSWESLPGMFALAVFFLCFKVFIEGGRGKK